MEDISELRSVLGMTPGLYETIEPFIGLNGRQLIEIDSAPPVLIDALTGQKGLGARIHKSPREVRSSMLLSGAAADLFAPARSSAMRRVRMRAFVTSEAGRGWQREVWIDIGGRPDALTPWATLSIEPTRRFNKPEQEFKP